MVAQLPVERVELLARPGLNDAGDAQVFSLPAGAHLDGLGEEVGRVPENDFHDRLGEARLLAAHHLDGKVAGKSERGSFLGRLQVERASPRCLTPVRITLCLNSW